MSERYELNKNLAQMLKGGVIMDVTTPEKRAAAIVQAVTNYTDAKLIAELSEDLGEAMVGINEQEIEILMAERGK